MTLNFAQVIAAICGTTISAGIIAIAVGLNRLNCQMAMLNTQFSRMEKDIAALSDRVTTLYEEHMQCGHCREGRAP